MRFGDYLIYQGLCENNRALHLLGQRQPVLDDSVVVEMGVVVERLAAYWLLLNGSLPADDARAARARLKRIQRALACALARLTIFRTIETLAGDAPSDKSRRAVQVLAERLNAPGSNEVKLAVPRDLVASGFQEDSLGWRGLDPETIDSTAVLEQYRRSYRKGRRSGLRALDAQNGQALGRWRRWTAVSLAQLELVRGALPEQSAQTRFYLQRLDESLTAHRNLDSVRAELAGADVSEKQKNRVLALVELRMRYSLERAAKLYPNCYRYAPKRYLASLQRGLNDLDFVNLVAELENRSA